MSTVLEFCGLNTLNSHADLVNSPVVPPQSVENMHDVALPFKR